MSKEIESEIEYSFGLQTRILTVTESLNECTGFAWQGCVSHSGGFYEKLLEASPVSDRTLPAVGSPCWSRLLTGVVASWREEPTWEQVCLQCVPEGPQPAKGTHAGATCEELQPVGRIHTGEVHRELSPAGGSPG